MNEISSAIDLVREELSDLETVIEALLALEPVQESAEWLSLQSLYRRQEVLVNELEESACLGGSIT